MTSLPAVGLPSSRTTRGILVPLTHAVILPKLSQNAYCMLLDVIAKWAWSFDNGVSDAMLIGHVRASKAGGSQLLDLQRDALIDADVKKGHIYEACASGHWHHRPGLDVCLMAPQAGKTFIIWKLDRMGRDLNHLVATVERLHARDVGLRVLTSAGAEMDTAAANGRFVFGSMFTLLAEFEGELIAERTPAGLAAGCSRDHLGAKSCALGSQQRAACRLPNAGPSG